MDPLACSLVTASQGEPLAGTAPLIEHLVGVTLPLPWPAKIVKHPLLAGLNTDSMTVVGLTAEASTRHRVISYRPQTPGVIGPLERYEVETQDLVSTIEGLIAQPHHPVTEHDQQDLFICTHGSRDRCCGSSGTVLYMEMLAEAPERLRIWRASHLGGHRFAPTVISLPDGLSWGFLDAQSLTSILNRSAPPETVAALLRGHIGAPNRATQAADAAGFAAQGWSWVGQSRTTVTTERKAHTEVTITPGGHGPSAEFKITELDPVRIPPCGEPIENSVKSYTPLAAYLK